MRVGEVMRAVEEGGMIIEGSVISAETGLSATFQGVEQPYVRCVVARLDDPQRHAEARILGLRDLPVAIGETIRLEVLRAVTDRREGVVRFDCRILTQ